MKFPGGIFNFVHSSSLSAHPPNRPYVWAQELKACMRLTLHTYTRPGKMYTCLPHISGHASQTCEAPLVLQQRGEYRRIAAWSSTHILQWADKEGKVQDKNKPDVCGQGTDSTPQMDKYKFLMAS